MYEGFARDLGATGLIGPGARLLSSNASRSAVVSLPGRRRLRSPTRAAARPCGRRPGSAVRAAGGRRATSLPRRPLRSRSLAVVPNNLFTGTDV